MWLKLTSTDVGAPVLQGVNGALCNVLDWALPQASWAIEHTATNARVYRPSIGNRHRLHVRHDSAVSGAATRAMVRGCEDATDAITLIDPFPTVAQVANNTASWLVSNTASAAARGYVIYLSETFFIMLMDTTDALAYTLGMFGDCPPMYPGETTWNTICSTRNSSTNGLTTGGLGSLFRTVYATDSQLFFARSVDGFVKSSRAGFYGSGSQFCNLASGPVPRGGYQNRIYRERVYANCIGSSTTAAGPLALMKRCAIPNLWNPMHSGSGSLNSNDTFSDNAYDPLAVFRFFASGQLVTDRCLIIEETDTWSPA